MIVKGRLSAQRDEFLGNFRPVHGIGVKVTAGAYIRPGTLWIHIKGIVYGREGFPKDRIGDKIKALRIVYDLHLPGGDYIPFGVPAAGLKIYRFPRRVDDAADQGSRYEKPRFRRFAVGELNGIRRPVHLHRVPCGKGRRCLELAGKNASCAVQARQSVDCPAFGIIQLMHPDSVQKGLVDRRSGLRGLVCPGHGLDAGLSLHRQELHPPGVGGHPVFDVSRH